MRGFFAFVTVLMLVIGVAIGFFAATRFDASSVPFDPNKIDWILIRAERGPIDPTEGDTTTRVYVYRQLSTIQSPVTYLQNRIEVQRGNETTIFMWPDSYTYATGWCDILDLDRDLVRDFIFFGSFRDVRIVAYHARTFQFRERLDELDSEGLDIRLVDLNGDGVMEFLRGVAFPSRLSPKRVIVPHIMSWSRANGFIDISRNFPHFYRGEIIPTLQKQASTSGDELLRSNYLAAIEDIEKQFNRTGNK